MKKALVVLAATALLGCGSQTTAGAPRFATTIDNPWLPFEPGATWTYTGEKDGKPSRDVVTVVPAKKLIEGVRCTSVKDRLYERGRLAERTTDWYAQDAAGNVWYYGEDTAELDARGKVTSTEGTWRAGVRGARAGIVMPAHPHVGQSAIQELYPGHAEDHFRVLRVSKGALLTMEWTPLEPGVIDHKLYRRGVGNVKEQTVKGGNERAILQSVTHR
jgi:hypothetical protein